MIEESYCSFEVAKLLKEKGFNAELSTFYSPKGELQVWCPSDKLTNSGTETGWWSCLAPSHQMAMAWLRKEHHKIIIIRYGKVGYAGEPSSKWHLQWWWELLNKRGEFCESNMNTGNSSPEEAIEEAIKHVLENLA